MRGNFRILILFLSFLFGFRVLAYNTLPNSRFLTFDDYDDSVWTHTGDPAPGFIGVNLKDGTVHEHNAGWLLNNVRSGYAGSYGRTVPPVVATNCAANLRNADDAEILSPYYSDGLGTINFDAVNSESATAIGVYIATNMNYSGGGLAEMQPQEDATHTNNWKLVETIALNHSADFGRYSVAVNYTGAARFKIVRPSAASTSTLVDDQFIVVDNIQVSYVPPYVGLSQTAFDLTPAPDFSSGSLTLRCTVDHYSATHSDFNNTTVEVWYRTASEAEGLFGDWNTLPAEYVADTGDANGNGREYEVIIALAKEGAIEYYYSCSFDGHFVPQDYTDTGYDYPYSSESLAPQHLYADGMNGNTPFSDEWAFGSTPPVTELPNSRILILNDYTDPRWTHQGDDAPAFVGQALRNGTYHFDDNGWILSDARFGFAKSFGRIVPPVEGSPSFSLFPLTIPTNNACCFRNVAGGYIESPYYEGGVGTVYFEAVNSEASSKVNVYWATDMDLTNTPTYIEHAPIMPEEGGGYVYNWRLLDVVELNYSVSGEFARYRRKLNYRAPVKFKIVRPKKESTSSDFDDQFVVVDNVRISPPPADVVITRSEVVHNPGYPNANQDFTVRCTVDNADPNEPTEMRSVFLVSRWRYLDQTVQEWQTNQMEYVQGSGDADDNGEVYRITVPQIGQEGDLEYYFTCFFGGFVYESPDYTASGVDYPYPTENLSPRTLRQTGPDMGDWSIRLRPYDSRYGAVYIVADQYEEPIGMRLVGDHQWQGMVPLPLISPTNLTWCLMAEKEHLDGETSFETNRLYWANSVPFTGAVPTLPYGGLCAETNSAARIEIAVTDGGYMEVNFNTENLEFLVNRAEYQNFNSWTARDEYFSDSSGQVDKQRFENTFNEWEISEEDVFIEPFTSLSVTDFNYKREPFATPSDWVGGSARYAQERTLDLFYKPAGILDYRNLALRLRGGDPILGLGYVYNQVAALPDGLKEVRFRARIGQSTDNFDISYYKDSFTEFNYVFQASVRCGKISPENPSISVVGYYSDPGQFYELRVTQIEDGRDTENNFQDKRVELALYKWVGGVSTRLGNSQFYNNFNMKEKTLPIRIGFYNVSSSQTRIKCSYGTASFTQLDSSSPLTMGSFGVLSSECEAYFSAMRTYVANSDADPANTSYANLMTASDWFTPLNVYEYRPSGNPEGIYKIIPEQQLDIYLQPADYETTTGASVLGTLDWVLHDQKTVANFEYDEIVLDLNDWQANYVLLQVGAGGNDVAVDELQLTSWHGKKIGIGDIDDDEWYTAEGWVVPDLTAPDITNNLMRLDLTRADPDVDQAIRSRYLDNGLGMVEFNYRVITPPARITVQHSREYDQNDWYDVKSFYVSNVTDWAHASAYLGSNTNGYFRVLNNREGGYANAVVEFDNVIVWDEPYVDITSWKAYNTRITSTDPQRLLLDEGKSCYLNNSYTDQVDPTPLDRDAPNLQSPVLVNGFGKLSLLARAYEPGEPVSVYVYASTNGWHLPVEEWPLIHTFADIDHEYYKPYSYKPVDGSMYDAIRLETVAGVGLKRACIDEVVISEPVYPGFDIVNVNLRLMERDGSFGSRTQPLPFEDVHLEATLANQQLSPSNIVLYVSYYIGDDIWGAENWFNSPEVVTKRMHQVVGEPNRYETRNDDGGIAGLPQSQIGGITGTDAGEVVQYRVWASYMGGIPLYEYQEIFINPLWYYPVNFNVSRAAEGWSPYYIVYSVPPSTVWVNEVNGSDLIWDSNFTTQHGIWENAYIEIAVPAWLDLGGWKIDLVTSSSYNNHTIQIPPGLPQQVAVTNGYAFFVIAEAIPPYQQTPALPKVDFAYAGLASLMPQIVPGGIRLRRPEGMYEQTIAYDDATWNTGGDFYDGSVWAANDPEGFFIYVGAEKSDGSLSRVGQGDSTNSWVYPLFPEWGQEDPNFALNYTPGMPNGAQWLPDGDELFPGTSNVMIRSNITQLRASQNGKRVLDYSLRMRVGSQTNITYDVDSWYRLVSVTSNGFEQLPPESALTEYTYGLNNIAGDVHLQATINLREDLIDYQGDSSVLNWIMGFPEAPLVPMFYNGHELSLKEQFWLDANPTASNEFACVIRNFEFDDQTNLHVRIEMRLNDNNMTNIQGDAVLKLESKEDMLAEEWDMIKQFYLTPDSFDINNQCHMVINNPFGFIITNYGRESFFMRIVIEHQDPRVRIYELENEPPD